jgi:cobalt-precorrin 5A hydrolase
MSRTAIVAISRRGSDLARRLASSLPGQPTLHLDRRFFQVGDRALPFDLPVRPLIQQWFGEHQRLVLFMPVGAAVRLLAPCLGHKGRDPAVVCVDDNANFAVSLLSGHVGGADLLAEEVASALDATPVITSASHVTGTLAVDLLGREFGWKLQADSQAITRASAAVVNGEPVGLYQQSGEPNWWPEDTSLPQNIRLYDSLPELALSHCVAALIVTDYLAPLDTPMMGHQGESCRAALAEKVMITYRPRTLVAGMGCRRGVPLGELEELLVDTLAQHNLSVDSLCCIATADLKQDEPGILQLAEKYRVPLQCYSATELNSVFEDGPDAVDGGPARAPTGVSGDVAQDGIRPTPKPRVHRLLGIWGVSEPAALLASGSPGLLVSREQTHRATIALARRQFSRPVEARSAGE